MKSILPGGLAQRILTLGLLLFTQTLFAGDISFFGLFKMQNFNQTNNAAPVADSVAPFGFQCNVDSSGPDLITDASVQLPGGGSRTLLADGSDSFAFRESFSSLSALNSSYGTGTYTLTVNSENDFNFAQLSLPSDAYPSTPQITNYTAAQAVDSSNNFVVLWQAFAGGTANDFIQLTIRDSSDNPVFRSGDFGSPGAFNGTNSSALIPANTLFTGETYNGELLFARLTTIDSTSIPGATGVVAFTKRTRFSLKTTGVVPPITLRVIGFTNGNFQFSFNTQPGKNYQIQFADTLPNWQNLQFTNAASSEIIFTDPFGGFNPQRFYQVMAP
ncbi:MAG: hypothetical protein ABJC04_06230 [Verrucomicrobiota bacterium]